MVFISTTILTLPKNKMNIVGTIRKKKQEERKKQEKSNLYSVTVYWL